MDLLGLTSDELAARARTALGKGAGVAAAVYGQVMRTGQLSPEDCGLGPRAAVAWRAQFPVALPAVVDRIAESSTECAPVEKAALELSDGHRVETVHLPMGRGRSSQCLSTQVGCARTCTFCETGRMGLLRNLSAAEIVAQVVVGRAALGWNPRTLVFQGMGEPLDNVDALVQSLHVLTDRRGLAFAHDRITVCTVGHVPGIATLAALGWKRLGLALSLHAGDDALRAQIMPGARRWPLRELQQALVEYRQRKNLSIGVHYCLLPGINDARADAKAVARFCAPLGRVMVHLIPYNAGTAPLTRAPAEDEVVRFVGWLRDEGLPVRRRIVKGRSVMAACGQLGVRD